MESKLRQTALQACNMLLRPLVSILLKCGLTWDEFADVAKWMFVDVASKEYGIKGRPTNMARISILTGINRKEVKRQREIEPDKTINAKASDATRVLYAWHHDPEFLDKEGQPRILAVSEKDKDFDQLHNRYGGDVSMQAMMKELLKSGCIAFEGSGEDKKLRVLKSYFMPQSMEPEILLHTGMVMRDLAATINNNIEKKANEDKHFEGYAAIQNVDVRHQAAFHKFLKNKGQTFLDEVDAWLNLHQSNDAGMESLRLGVGMYAIETISK